MGIRTQWKSWFLGMVFFALGAVTVTGLWLYRSNPRAVEEPPTITVSYAESNEHIVNPERGFYSPIDDLLDAPNMSSVQLSGNSLIRSYIRLDDWRESDLPQSLLNDLDAGLAEARAAGLKTILRFSYNFGPYPNSEPDASKEQILSHIEQLKPVLQKNADVIVWVEAGFIGAWGEWHTSTHGLDKNPDAKREILEALLNALPPSRMVQLRYPVDIRLFSGQVLTEDEAFSGSDQARVGHHNDCLLASEEDWGTYKRDFTPIETDKAYLAELGRFAPIGGETCNNNPPQSDCPTALAELERLHFSEINIDYHPEVISAWQEQGCFEEIQLRLGYRLALTTATFNDRVRPGGVISLTVNLENTGFASPINPRSIYVVLDGPANYSVALPAVDPRRWEAGSTSSFSIRLRVPADAPEGTYHLALWLPDPAESLSNDPRYAIRLANQDTWEEKTGYNILSRNILIDSYVSGASDPNNTEFSVLE